jgi:peroxin-5
VDALVLQDDDVVRDPGGLNEGRGVESGALWDSLKTACMHMDRVDLTALCDRQDLEGERYLQDDVQLSDPFCSV